MILGIGIDLVEIDRFKAWTDYSKDKLLKLFSESEVEYCLENSKKSAERLAARFATREAFYKAFSQMAPDNDIPFLELCKLVKISANKKGAPLLLANWPIIRQKTDLSLDPEPLCWISITHTSKQATAMVIIEKRD